MLINRSSSQYAQFWSTDDQLLVFEDDGPPPLASELMALPLEGEPYSIVSGPDDQYRARLSPDGSWMAYVSLHTGVEEVYVQAFPEPGASWSP